MTLLEVITKAVADHPPPASMSNCPTFLNLDEVFLNLKPQSEDSDDLSFIKPLTGWQISKTDLELNSSAKSFFRKLKRKSMDQNGFNKKVFAELLNSFLEKGAKIVGISIGVGPSIKFYTQVLIEKVGFLMGEAVAQLVVETCVSVKHWELLESLIVNSLVERRSYSKLVVNLVDKKRSDLLCLCIKHFQDLQSSDLQCILKYFLSLQQDVNSSMVKVRKEWESQALLAIEKAGDKSIQGKKLQLAKEASVLLMIAHDGFSVSELCLHYLLSSLNLDEVILSSAISKLNGSEIMGLIQYLNKWLKKYERFPQAGPCPKASSVLGLKACEWVPKFEDIVKCLGLVVDEHFSSLVLNPAFHEELRSMEGMISALALESKLCCSMAYLVDNLITEGRSV